MVAAQDISTRPAKLSRRAQGPGTSLRTADRREKRYAALLAQGLPQWKAYQAVSGAKNKDTCEKQGQRWFARACVQAELARLRRELTEDTAATRAEKRNHLARIMRSEETPPSVVVSAVAVDNRMTGDDEPFRKAAGDDLRVAIFVVRLGEDAANANGGERAPGLPADPADAARNVTPTAGEATPSASDASAPS